MTGMHPINYPLITRSFVDPMHKGDSISIGGRQIPGIPRLKAIPALRSDRPHAPIEGLIEMDIVLANDSEWKEFGRVTHALFMEDMDGKKSFDVIHDGLNSVGISSIHSFSLTLNRSDYPMLMTLRMVDGEKPPIADYFPAQEVTPAAPTAAAP